MKIWRLIYFFMLMTFSAISYGAAALNPAQLAQLAQLAQGGDGANPTDLLATLAGGGGLPGMQAGGLGGQPRPAAPKQESPLSPEEQQEIDQVCQEADQELQDLDIQNIQTELCREQHNTEISRYRTLQEKRRWNNTIVLGGRRSKVALYNSDLTWLASVAARWGIEALYLRLLQDSRIEFITQEIIAHRAELVPILKKVRKAMASVKDEQPGAELGLDGAPSQHVGTDADADESSDGKNTEEQKRASKEKKKKKSKKRKTSRTFVGRLKQWLFGASVPLKSREKALARLSGHLKQYHLFNPLQAKFIIHLLLTGTAYNAVLAAERSVSPSYSELYSAELGRAGEPFRRAFQGFNFAGDDGQNGGNQNQGFEEYPDFDDGTNVLTSPVTPYVQRVNPVTGRTTSQLEPVRLEEGLPPVSLKTVCSVGLPGFFWPKLGSVLFAPSSAGYKMNTNGSDELSTDSGFFQRSCGFPTAMADLLYSPMMDKVITYGGLLLMPMYFEATCRSSWEEFVTTSYADLLQILAEDDGTPGSEAVLYEKVKKYVTQGHAYKTSSSLAVYMWNAVKGGPTATLEAIRSVPFVCYAAYKACKFAGGYLD